MSADSVFDRPRPRRSTWQRALPYTVAGALVIAVLVFVGYHYSNTGKSLDAPLTNRPAQDNSAVPNTVKIDPAAERVARRFVQTAVARKHLAEAYGLVGPAIKQGQSLESWKTGNIAVVPYPLDQLDFAPMKVDFSYPKEVQIQVALLPKKGADVPSALFTADLIKVRGKWLVNLWTPRGTPPVPNGSQNNGGGG